MSLASKDEVLTELLSLGCSVEPCGSRVTCNPAPTDTDEDHLVEIKNARQDKVSEVVSYLQEMKFRWEGDEHYQEVAVSGFMSWRRESVNLIVTADAWFARHHRAASSICKRMNLLRKEDRIAVFRAVLYGEVAA